LRRNARLTYSPAVAPTIELLVPDQLQKILSRLIAIELPS
jgi:hypothetical protein